MSGEYALVSESEATEAMELPCEEDGSLLLSTVRAQFPGACGLQYRGGGRRRGLRLAEDRLWAPRGGWATQRYWCSFPRERAASPLPPPPPSDLIVLGLPWRTSEDSLRDYFQSFGELLMVQVKRDPRTGLSKGFGFVKFADIEAQAKVLARRHMIDGRWCDVRIPNSKDGSTTSHRKVFVGRCTESITAEDLREYFGAFGQVTDVFVPKPFRAFSFVTFLDSEVAQSLCGQDHIIKGVSVNISTASPKRARSASAGAGAAVGSPGGGGGVPAAAGGAEGDARSALLGGCGLGWGMLDASRVYNYGPPTLEHKPYIKYE